jgi:TolA-binding protein
MQQLDRAQRDADAAWQLVRSSNSPRRPDLLYLLAELSAEQGERDRARQYLQSLIESFPSSDAAILARRKLQQMAVK